MKLVRFKHGSAERMGALVGDTIVDLALARAAWAIHDGAEPAKALADAELRIPQTMRAFLSAGSAARDSAEAAAAHAMEYPTDMVEGRSITQPLSSATLLPPVGDPQKIICIGQNYRDHCAEQNQPLPERAIIFSKFPSALIGHGGTIVLPRISEQVDYEAELAFVIGKRGRHIDEANAAEYIAGYMCLNDVSARDIQFGDKQWVRGKTFDTFAPTGPALVTADEIEDPHNLDIGLTLNGNVMQKSNTSNLIFGVYYLVSYLSDVVTLEPGDIVTTGTPGGVGIFRNPPVLLKPGDEVSVTIAGLGTLTNSVAAES